MTAAGSTAGPVASSQSLADPRAGWRSAFDHRPPTPIKRLRDLEPRWKGVAVVVLVLLAVLPLLAMAKSVADGWVPTGDEAIIALRADDVAHLRPPTLGQPTTGDAGGNRQSNQMGPIEYYLLAPTVGVFGQRAGVALGAALMTSAFLAGAALVAYRHGGLPLMTLIGAGSAVTLVHLGLPFAHQPLNSEIPTFGILFVLLASWACSLGDTKLVPYLVLAGTFILQSHIAGGVVVLAPLAIGLYGAWRATFGHGADPAAAHRARRTWLLWGGLLAVPWLPTLVHEATASSSNLTALAEGSFNQPGDDLGLGRAFQLVGGAVGPVPIFAHHLPYGEQLDLRPVPVVLVGWLLVAGLVGLGVLAHRTGDVVLRRWITVLLSILPLAVFTLSRVAGAATFRPDVMRWVWIFSALVWISFLWGATRLLLPARAAGALTSVAAGVLGGAVLVGLINPFPGDPNQDHREVTVEVADAIQEAVPRGAYRIGLSGIDVPLGVGPAVISDLEDRGFGFEVDAGFFSRAYGSRRTGHSGTESRPLLWVVDHEPGAPGAPKEGGELIYQTVLRGNTVEVYLYPPGTP